MPVATTAVGKTYDPIAFEVSAEQIAKYADAVGESGAIHRDPEAARAAGFRDVVAPPMFAVLYGFAALITAGVDPEVGMNLPTMVHGGQLFEWGEPVCAGDTITTTGSVKEIYQRDDKGFYVFETVSVNQDGLQTARGVWTDIVRGV